VSDTARFPFTIPCLTPNASDQPSFGYFDHRD